VYELFSSLFPSGSVTGAPKIRAMEIIRELEDEERRIYTGAIGYILPNRDMFFNIPIRTLLLSDKTGEMGIGGGIVWDSTPQGEWDEGILKASFIMKTL
ncbi:MAG TPA: chorismate-binding protein, partial [Candidatus Omnitrophota bacterium]|nr:chorismate-binding protein [Candidatus Omnitrophota bacterium]